MNVVKCPRCATNMTVGQSAVEFAVACPSCGVQLKIPATVAPPTAPLAAAARQASANLNFGGSETMFCSACGNRILARAFICPNCGVPTANAASARESEYRYVPDRKSSGAAAALSFLFVGLGQIYNGLIFKGIFLAVLAFSCIGICIAGGFVFGLFLVIIWIVGIYDAYSEAEEINERARRRRR